MRSRLPRCLAAAAAFGLLAGPAGAAGDRSLRGHLPPAAARTEPLGRLPSTNRLDLAIGLPLRDTDALERLLARLHDPASPDYRRYLTPAQFAERFGPTEADYAAVAAFARAHGLVVKARHADRRILDVQGAAADVERAFGVTLHVYRHPREGRRFYGPDREPAVAKGLPVADVWGLSDFPRPRPMNTGPRPRAAAAAAPSGGSGPGGAYRGYDFRNAYAVGATNLTGLGQVIGLLQVDGFYTNDIAAYASQAGLPNVPLQTVLLDGFTGTPGINNAEVAMDIELAISMAPGLAGVIVYEGNPGSFYPTHILSRMASDNLARQISSSWTWTGGPSSSVDSYLQQMAAQGQSYFQASGDSDAYPAGFIDNAANYTAPVDSPYLTCVGGTTLTMAGSGAAWSSETVWNWGGGTGSSGGSSSYYAIPAWQAGVSMAGNQGSAVYRNVPDVALTADDVYVIHSNGSTDTFGGTSCAAPLWAGFCALANERAAQRGLPPVGFLNPALYRIGAGAAYGAAFHDTTTGNNTSPSSPAAFYAVAGYDLCTGWGTPTGIGMIELLVTPGVPAVTNAGWSLAAEAFAPGNGAVDPAENVSVSLSLRNGGTSNTVALVATLLATNGVLSPGPPQSYGVLVTNGPAVSRTYAFTASAGAPLGSTIMPTLRLQDGTNDLGTVAFPLALGAADWRTTWTQRFDGVTAPALPSGWTTATVGAVPAWRTTTSVYNGSPDTAPNAAWVTNAAVTGLTDLVSAPIAVSASNARLLFRNYYTIEGNATIGYDGGVLDIRIGTNAFQDVVAAGGTMLSNGYNRTVGSSHGNPLAGRSAWSYNSGGFLTTVVILPAAAARTNVQFRWRLGTDSNTGRRGWYVDTITLYDALFSGTPARLAAAPAAADFGALTVGAASQRVFAVTNTGGAEATGVTVRLQTAGGPFSLVGPTNFSLPVYGATNVIVRFAPVSGGPFSNALVLASPNGGGVTNAVTGQGVPGFFTLTALPAANGAVAPASTNVPPGGSATFAVTASNYYRIAALQTNGAPAGPAFSNGSTSASYTWSNVLAAGTFGAAFTARVLADPAATPCPWLAQYGLAADTNAVNGSGSDTDHDGLLAWQEYVAGTSPTDSLSVLRVTALDAAGGTNLVLRWNAVTGRTYAVEQAAAPAGGAAWTGLGAPLPGTGAAMAFTNGAAAGTSAFWRVRVSL
jgi:hypothetical protein